MFLRIVLDNAVIGAINFIDTPNFVYGNFYIVRAEYHAAGVGALLMRTMLTHLAPQLKSKGFVSRAGRAVYKVYVSWPTNAIYLYNVWSVKITGFDDLRQLFPLNKAHSYHVATMKDVLKDHKMMTAVEKYDQFVTGQERSLFLRNYYSIDFVQGVVIFDNAGQVKGMSGIVPTGNVGGLYKMNPIYASCHEDAVLLMHLVAQKANHPNLVFLIHVRTKTAGDWILNKCKEVDRPLISRGCTMTLPAYPLYKDRAKTQFMYAPTNSPAHFDG